MEKVAVNDVRATKEDENIKRTASTRETVHLDYFWDKHLLFYITFYANAVGLILSIKMFHFLCSFLSLAGPQTAPCFLAVLLRPRGVVLTSRASLHVTCLFGRCPPPTCVDPRLLPGKSFLTERFWRSLTFITTNSIMLVKSLQFQGQTKFSTAAAASD